MSLKYLFQQLMTVAGIDQTKGNEMKRNEMVKSAKKIANEKPITL